VRADGATALTNSEGLAEFENLSCGTKTISINKEGFAMAAAIPFRAAEHEATDLVLTLALEVVHGSVDVHDTAPAVESNSSETQQLRSEDVKNLPFRPVIVTDALPLVPGVNRTPDGEIKIDGTGEHRSALVVNQADVTDPATGQFGQTVPIDSVQNMDVLNSPFVAQYGNFTAGVVSVETRRGGEKWSAELNDPLPDFRFRSWRLRGLRDATPRAVAGGPLIANRLYFIDATQYGLIKKPERTLPYPYNESKQASLNSLSQFDYIASSKQTLTVSWHFSPQHTNFVHPEFFNPQPVAPSYAQHNYVATVTDHLEVGGGTLASVVSEQRYDATVGAQGSAEMILTPTGNRGNYFSTQRREAGRTQWLETWSPRTVEARGRHDLMFGTAVTFLNNAGQTWDRPVNMLDITGLLLRRIEFTGGRAYRVSDFEAATFAQDHWSIAPRLALDAGGRIEWQDIAGSVRLAPRIGLGWIPFSGGGTVVRAGYGYFFDRVPLSVYTFGANPQRTIVDYAPDGTIAGEPVSSVNVLGAGTPGSPLIHSGHIPGNFAPRSAVWNIQVEQRVARWLRIRTVYTKNRSAGLVMLEPQMVDSAQLMLMGRGRSYYRQLEVTGKFEWKDGQHLFLAYTHSRAQGNLGEFSEFLGNFPMPLIRPNVYSNLPGDLPNRFLAWGRVNLFAKAEFFPILEYRNGFPYAKVDALGDYVGMPNGDHSRFPNFFSADARIQRDVKINPKYTFRFAASGFNLSNHFNALSVHANIADPQYGVFFGNYHLRYRADFDVLF
jgi:hypothetical protein